MIWQNSPYVVSLIVTAAIAFMLSLYCWGRRPDRAATYFALLLFAVSEWAFFSGLESSATGSAIKIFFSKLEFVGISGIGPLWLLFALSFGRQEAVLTRLQRALLWVFPAVIVGLAATNELHGLVWPRIEPASPGRGSQLIYDHGPAIWANAVYVYTLVAVGTFFILRTAIRSPRLYRRQAMVLIVGAVIPWVGSILYLSVPGVSGGRDFTPIGFAISGILVTWSVFRFRFLSLVPVAHEKLFAGMTDGVIALDADSRVIDINAAARKLIDLQKDAIGKSVKEVFAAWPHYLERFRGLSQLQAEIPIGSAEEPGWVDLRISPLYGDQGRLNGRLITLRDITEQKRTEAARRRSEGMFRLLVENAPDAIFVQTEGHFAYVNPGTCRLLGADAPEKLLGRSVVEQFHPDFRETVAERIRKVNVDRERSPANEQVLLKLDGTPVTVEVAAVPIVYEDKNGALVFVRDVTGRKRTEAALFEQGRRFKGIYDHTDDAVFLIRVEPAGRLVYEGTNPIHQLKSGLRPEDLWEKTPEEALPPAIAAHVRARYEECLRRGEPYTYEEDLDLPTGPKTWQTQLVPIPGPDGCVNLIAGFSRDITEQKRTEAALRASDEEKGVLLKEIHHRVKNNMQVISSMLNLQSREIRDPMILEMFRDTQTRIRSMALVHEKLYQSRDLSRVDFPSYLQSLIVHLFHAHKIDPDRVRYELRIEEAFLNINTAIPVGLIVSELLSNSLKYAFPKGRNGAVRIGLGPAPDGRLLLIVADDGIGLPPDLDVRTTESLGLQIVGMLIEQLDGELEVARKAGTEFRIAFREPKTRRPS